MVPHAAGLLAIGSAVLITSSSGTPSKLVLNITGGSLPSGSACNIWDFVLAVGIGTGYPAFGTGATCAVERPDMIVITTGTASYISTGLLLSFHRFDCFKLLQF